MTVNAACIRKYVWVCVCVCVCVFCSPVEPSKGNQWISHAYCEITAIYIMPNEFCNAQPNSTIITNKQFYFRFIWVSIKSLLLFNLFCVWSISKILTLFATSNGWFRLKTIQTFQLTHFDESSLFFTSEQRSFEPTTVDWFDCAMWRIDVVLKYIGLKSVRFRIRLTHLNLYTNFYIFTHIV